MKILYNQYKKLKEFMKIFMKINNKNKNQYMM